MQSTEEDNFANSEQMLPPGDQHDSESIPSSSAGSLREESTEPTPPRIINDPQHNKFRRLFALLSPLELCPMPTILLVYLTWLGICAIFGALLYVLVSLPWADPIRTPVLQLAALGALAWFFGHLAAFACLPPLLGMLLAGMLLRITGHFHAQGSFQDVVRTIRVVAMTVILLKAGLGLDGAALRRLSMAVLRLAICPCCVEAGIVSITAHFLLGFPWLWGLLLGCVLGAVSPAVVVPSLLDLKARGYGEDKGISTLVIAASSIDDIIAISMFGVFISAIFSQGSLIEQILRGPIEMVIGLLWGIGLGLISIILPHRDDDFVVGGRILMVGGSGLLVVLGSQWVGYVGAGPVACITCAFVASCGWKNLGTTSSYIPVMDCISKMWLLFQPFLFGLIGAEIDITSLDNKVVGLGAVILVIGLVMRLLTSALAVQGAGLSPREVVFVSIAWLPKATVQAAIGPVALDMACREQGSGSEEKVVLAHAVLTIAVLSILATAPIGAIGILLSGPKLLKRSETTDILAHNTSPTIEDVSQARVRDTGV